MDQHRTAQLSGPRPKRVQPLAVHGNKSPGAILHAQSEILPDLQTFGAIPDSALEFQGGALTEIRQTSQPVPADAGEDQHAIAERAPLVHLPLELIREATIQIDHGTDAGVVQDIEQLV